MGSCDGVEGNGIVFKTFLLGLVLAFNVAVSDFLLWVSLPFTCFLLFYVSFFVADFSISTLVLSAMRDIMLGALIISSLVITFAVSEVVLRVFLFLMRINLVLSGVNFF